MANTTLFSILLKSSHISWFCQKKNQRKLLDRARLSSTECHSPSCPCRCSFFCKWFVVASATRCNVPMRSFFVGIHVDSVRQAKRLNEWSQPNNITGTLWGALTNIVGFCMNRAKLLTISELSPCINRHNSLIGKHSMYSRNTASIANCSVREVAVLRFCITIWLQNEQIWN